MSWYYRLTEQLRFAPFTFLWICALLAALVVNLGEDPLGLRVGQRLPRAITSRVAFRLEDDRRTQLMRMHARDTAPDYYTLDALLLQDIRGRLTNALRLAREQATDPDKLRDKAREIHVLFDDQGLAEIVRLAAADDTALYQQAVDHATQLLSRQPLVEAEEITHRRTGTKAVLVDPERATEREVPSDRLLYANNREHVTMVATAASVEFPVPLRNTVKESLVRMLQAGGPDIFKPLYHYDTALSAKAAEDAAAAVETQYIEFAVGSRLCDAGPLTAEGLKLLEEERTHYLAERDPDPGLRTAHQLALLSRGLIAFLLACGVGAYILMRHGDSLRNPERRFATAVTMLLVLLLARVAYLDTTYIELAVGAQAFAVALMAITSGGGLAYASAALLALLIALATRQGVPFVATLIATSLLLFLGLRDVRNRGRIIVVGAVAAMAATFMTQLAGLINGQVFWFVFWNQALCAGLATLAAAFLVEGILPGIERIFGVTTSMTLLEWCDPNKPLLRMLAAESPGTYNHSLLVGTLADAAAEAIEANGLLARTGAYYHDIGKTNKPEYFVENQAMGVVNRHARLSPAMSHLIIIGHVKDGIEMAKEYHLPAVLHRFIPEHHGTCVVEYFYHAANKARKPGDPEISDEQFRYPGPKPQTRETAIVMLCDAVEGAVRAMSEPTPNRIEDTVAKITEKRLMDGQFDECDLTFRELETIRQSLVKTLSSIYHGRIVYPSADQEGETRHAS